MTAEELELPGCWLIRTTVRGDDRGRFVKTFEAGAFAALHLRSDWREEIHTTSRAGVVRGMHFQTPPAEQAKLLFCVVGEVLDVLVDLRRGSPTYGRHLSATLSESNGHGLYVPGGVAHGFAAIASSSTMFYKIAGAYSPEHDRGIAWDSFGFDWPFATPLLSERDREHPSLDRYDSPFVFGNVSA